MSTSVLFMSMSLDGYIAGPNDDVGNPGGDGFMRLHEWFGDSSRPAGAVGEMWDEWNPPGAIVAGRRTVEQVYRDPAEEYTRQLLDAIPVPVPRSVRAT